MVDRMKKPLIICAALLIAGCRMTEPSETPAADAREVVDSLVYVKARNGICFGVTTMTRLSSSGSITENVLLVSVSWEGVGL